MTRRPSALYVCYLTITDPLVETQVVAYLEGLARAGHRIHLLTFEARNAIDDQELREREAALAQRGITWHRARYRKRLSLPATILDALIGAAVVRRIVRRHHLQLVHARSHVPAAMALIARRLGGPPFIFDIRGLMAEEYVDAGRWKQDGLPFRITKLIERRSVGACDGAVVLTAAAREILFPEPGDLPVEVIPCCVDLANFPARPTTKIDEDPTFAYVGKFGGWYMDAEIARVFGRALLIWPEARLRVLTQSDPAEIRRQLASSRVDPSHVSIGTVPAEQVGAELARATVGLSLVRPVPSKVASSPTKNAEYLAAGLPLLATSGVAGTDDLALEFPGTVVSMREFDDAAIDVALMQARELIADEQTPARCRSAAQSLSLEQRGIPAYERLYEAVAARIGR